MPEGNAALAEELNVVEFISGGNEMIMAYINGVQRLVDWCVDNLDLNNTKTNELIVDLRRKTTSDLQPISIIGECVEMVSSFKCHRFQMELKHLRGFEEGPTVSPFSYYP